MEENCLPAYCRERVKHCDSRMEDTRRFFIAQVEAMEKSILQAKVDMERRLEGMNEFRAQLERQADTFLDKGYYTLEHKNMMDKVEILIRWKDRSEGKASWTNLMAAAALAISALVGLFPLLHFLTGVK